MNADTIKMIDICKNPEIQELIRKVWPDKYEGYFLSGLSVVPGKLLAIRIRRDIPILPFGFDEEKACSQIDVLLMEVNAKPFYFSSDYEFLDASFRAWKEHKRIAYSFKREESLDHSDLYLKLLWLEELMNQEAKDDSEI